MPAALISSVFGPSIPWTDAGGCLAGQPANKLAMPAFNRFRGSLFRPLGRIVILLHESARL